jgi:PPP family 3-phenylpropionic acid transporter
MSNAVYGTYLPVYLQSVGSTSSQIGLALSLGSLVSILAQPIWGSIADRAKTKNNVLKLMIVCSIGVILLFPLSDHFAYLLIAICVFTGVQTSIIPLTDTVTLEALDKQKRWTFGNIRMGGTFGFAAMSIAFGFIASKRIDMMFFIYAAILFVCFMLLFRFPAVSGHQSAGGKMNIGVLLKNRKLMTYLGISTVLQTLLGYYYTFYPIYMYNMGGNSVLLGWSMVISSLSEVPFLLLSGLILKRVRVAPILLAVSLVSALRWFAFSFTDNAAWFLPAQLLHGLMFIVLTVTMAVYINSEVPKELKASGQSVNALMTAGVARISGSFFGGIASDAFGIRQVFHFNGWLALVCAGFIVWVILRENAERRRQTSEQSAEASGQPH